MAAKLRRLTYAEDPTNRFDSYLGPNTAYRDWCEAERRRLRQSGRIAEIEWTPSGRIAVRVAVAR